MSAPFRCDFTVFTTPAVQKARTTDRQAGGGLGSPRHTIGHSIDPTKVIFMPAHITVPQLECAALDAALVVASIAQAQ